MRVFKTRRFEKWAAKEGLSNIVLVGAVDELKRGLVEANLGGHVYKKRVRLPGRGKSGSTRTIIAYKSGDKAFFIFGYAKRERDDIDTRELSAFKLLAKTFLEWSETNLERAIEKGELREVRSND